MLNKILPIELPQRTHQKRTKNATIARFLAQSTYTSQPTITIKNLLKRYKKISIINMNS
jgi:hypothetical protein